MRNATQEEIAKRFIEVRDLMDFLDDGYHNQEVFDLTKISNGLFERLNPINQQKAREWCEKSFGKYMENKEKGLRHYDRASSFSLQTLIRHFRYHVCAHETGHIPKDGILYQYNN